MMVLVAEGSLARVHELCVGEVVEDMEAQSKAQRPSVDFWFASIGTSVGSRIQPHAESYVHL